MVIGYNLLSASIGIINLTSSYNHVLYTWLVCEENAYLFVTANCIADFLRCVQTSDPQFISLMSARQNHNTDVHSASG